MTPLFVRQIRQSIESFQSDSDSQILMRKHIQPAQRKHQKHLCGPGSDTLDLRQFFDDFLAVDPYSVNDAEYDDARFALSDLSDADVDAAARAYQEDLQALWRELRQIDKRSLSERAVKFLEEVGKDR